MKQAGVILEEARRDVLVGVGGYVCTPMYLAARRRKIPIVIHEANTRPGLANRVGARLGGHVAVAFAATRLGASRHVGMPMRREISGLDRTAARAAARAALGLDPDRPALIVTGGSSGAQSINRTIAAPAGPRATPASRPCTSPAAARPSTTPTASPLAAPGYRQLEYVDGMETVYAAADLLLARSGAATVCEVAAVGVPAVFVPLPIGNGEQALNAAGLVEAGGALIVEDRTFSARLDPRAHHPAAAGPGQARQDGSQRRTARHPERGPAHGRSRPRSRVHNPAAPDTARQEAVEQ